MGGDDGEDRDGAQALDVLAEPRLARLEGRARLVHDRDEFNKRTPGRRNDEAVSSELGTLRRGYGGQRPPFQLSQSAA
ncbi:hypothetical protein NPS01_03210 [Nocardioides psychrotolerans]|nr:hypothetical protein NPS01_03210 [Nocardioides psychrotolerans]